MKYTAKEIILLMLTGMVITILVVPVLAASIGSTIKGEPITRTEFLKTAGDIVIYVLGIRQSRDPRKNFRKNLTSLKTVVA